MSESDQGATPRGYGRSPGQGSAAAPTKGGVPQEASAVTKGVTKERGKPAKQRETRGAKAARTAEPAAPGWTAATVATTSTTTATSTTTGKRKPRKARLRLTQIDAWSVMKTAFLLSIATGIVTIVAVAIVWSVLGAAGVWNSLNDTVQTVMGNDFRVQDYIGTGRVLGFTMLVAAVDVVLLTAIATLGAFLYNLSATLLGGIEVTLAEDN